MSELERIQKISQLDNQQTEILPEEMINDQLDQTNQLKAMMTALMTSDQWKIFEQQVQLIIKEHKTSFDYPKPQRLEYTEDSLNQAKIMAFKEILNLPKLIIDSADNNAPVISPFKIVEQ
jgi:hypothetical protein